MTGAESRRTIVLGATGGIGRALCRRLAADGHRLWLIGRDEERVAAMASELGAAGHATVDARDPDAVESAVRDAAKAMGGLDGVAHLVGSLHLGPAHATSTEVWDDVLATNLSSAFGVVRAAGKTMRREGGAVVLVSSAAAGQGLANHEAIAAAKAGVEGLALSAAATYASCGIRFNVVSPGLTLTPLTERLTSNDMQREASEKMHALGRLGEADEVASAVEWLLRPEQAFVTGVVVPVDGGLRRVRSRR